MVEHGFEIRVRGWAAPAPGRPLRGGAYEVPVPAGGQEDAQAYEGDTACSDEQI